EYGTHYCHGSPKSPYYRFCFRSVVFRDRLATMATLDESISLIAGAAIHAMLMAFGISLVGSRPLDKKQGRRRDTLLASTVKLLIHPTIAWLLAAFVFQLDQDGILTSTVLASLPTAQNV